MSIKTLIQLQSESYRKTEQLVLYVRSLQLLSSALQLSRREIQSGRLRTSTSVRTGIELKSFPSF